MKIGIFNKTFVRETLEENLDTVQASGVEAVQFNMETVAGEAMPAEIPLELCHRINITLAERQLDFAAVSGTFNMIHPDSKKRESGMQRLEVLTGACRHLDTPLITISTGTRNADYMWGGHAENQSPQTWADMLRSMERAVQLAEIHDVTLVFEPEVNNVVDSAILARRLLDEIASTRLQVVIDGANLFHAGELERMPEILDEAFDLLGHDIRLAHAKDLVRDGDAGHQAAGTGLLDYQRYLELLDRYGFRGAVILHSLEENQVANSLAYVRDNLP